MRAARVLLVRCAVEKSKIVCAVVAFGIPQSCVVSCCSLHFNFSAHPCRLQPMVLWPKLPSVIKGSTQWWQEWILSVRPCLVRPLHCLSLPVLTLFWWIDEVRCYTWPPTTWAPDVPFLSVVVRQLAPCGQLCQNKISFDRLQPEQIKQDAVRYSEVIWILYTFHVCIFIYVYCFYFVLFLLIFLNVFLILFISFYVFFSGVF